MKHFALDIISNYPQTSYTYPHHALDKNILQLNISTYIKFDKPFHQSYITLGKMSIAQDPNKICKAFCETIDKFGADGDIIFINDENFSILKQHKIIYNDYDDIVFNIIDKKFVIFSSPTYNKDSICFRGKRNIGIFIDFDTLLLTNDERIIKSIIE